MTITSHEFHWYIQSLMQKQQLLLFLDSLSDNLSSKNAKSAFTSYIRMSKVKVRFYKITVKIRIPNTIQGQKMIENNWDQIVDFVYRMNKNQYTLSSYKTLDPYYFIIEGTRK